MLQRLFIPACFLLANSAGFHTTTFASNTMQQQQPQQSQQSCTNDTTDADFKPNTKTVYLVRHAQSTENVIYEGSRRLVSALSECSLPSFSDLGGTLKLPFNMFRKSVMDAQVSEHGQEQINQLHKTLVNDSFLFDTEGKRDILVIHSPLRRAKQTAYGMFKGPNALDDEQASREKVNDVVPTESQTEAIGKTNDTVRFVELGALKEINPREIVTQGNRAIDKRIKSFEAWLSEQKEDPIVIVGHSVYFQRMLKLPTVFANCDVWEVQYALDEATIESKKKMDPTKNVKPGQSPLEGHIPPRSWMSMRHRYGYKVAEEKAEKS